MDNKSEAVKWLIEDISEDSTVVIYYFGNGSFTLNAWVAMSFDTESDANIYIDNNQETLSIHKVEAREHMFLN